MAALLGAALASAPLAQPGAAEIRYVTDELRLAMHERPKSAGRQLTTLNSGEAVEVLELIRNYAKVRAPDGTVGWAKSAYLVEEKPARLRLQELASRSATLESELGSTRKTLTEAQGQVERLEEQLASVGAQSRQRDQAMETLQNDNARYHARLAALDGSVPLTWALAAAGTSLFAGFILALLWVDRRIRRRHGGFRIY